MAQQVIVPIMPNLGSQAEAMAGAQAVTFTATERQIIKERGGEVDRNGPFKELFSKGGLTNRVENEESTVNPEQATRALESRRREHGKMLRDSPMTAPREHVEISNGEIEAAIIPPAVVIKPAAQPTVSEPETSKISQETAALAKELNFKPSEIFDKFTLEQSELHNLIYRIKELHLKRLLCGSQKEFEEISLAIEKNTLASARPEAKDWLSEEVNKLKKSAAEYKLKLIKSLQSMRFDDERDKNVRWLEKTIAEYS